MSASWVSETEVLVDAVRTMAPLFSWPAAAEPMRPGIVRLDLAAARYRDRDTAVKRARA
jgi:hypothetical protein